LVDVFGAIADPSRRLMLTMLAVRPRSGKELAARFTMSRSALSQHLKVLRSAGLVSVRKKGREHEYMLEVESLCALNDWLRPLVGRRCL
jgi:DNA-binding transcriptional ArsR family regulator